MNKTNYQFFQEICQKTGWKCTAQRLAVFDVIHENYSHPGVDEVWMQVKTTLPSVTRESIYRILNEFSAHGIIRRLDHIESARYDGQVGPHGHFLCTQCGDIQDFPLSDAVPVPKDTISGDIEHLELRLTGVCGRCKQHQPKIKGVYHGK
jgi:Fur family peroxide stress response transcriptional regulator